jgi:hypothetical protein
MLLYKNLFYDLFCVTGKFGKTNVILLKVELLRVKKKNFVNIFIYVYEKAVQFPTVWFYHINCFNRP